MTDQQVGEHYGYFRDREHSYAGSLSLGERRILELARVASGEPSAVILDEPSAGLDDMALAETARYIRDLRKMEQGDSRGAQNRFRERCL